MTLTIRRTLLLSFIALTLTPCVALGWMAFARTRAAMTDQIVVNLDAQAQSLQSSLDKMLFERFENALIWSRSELMLDLAVGDVDKRVANYLRNLRQGYGDVYAKIACVAPGGQVLASSDPAEIGRREPGLMTGPPMEVTLGQGPVRMEFLESSLAEGAVARISAAIPGANRGDRLSLDFQLTQIRDLLDRAAVRRRMVVVIDAQGRLVAASSGVSPAKLAPGRALGNALEAAGASAPVLARSPWSSEALLVGRAHSTATPTFAGSGWTTLVLEPVDEALAPVTRMAGVFAVLVALVLVAALAAAYLISARLARPIQALTARTRDPHLLAASAHLSSESGIEEIRTLEHSFTKMTEDLQHSQAELVRASRMAMLGELAAVLAHEVRTPLGIMRSSAQVLQRDRQLAEDSRELVGFIESETQRLNRLVTTLLESTRPRQASPSRCDVNALVERCVQMARVEWRDARRPPPEIFVEAEAVDPWAELDAEMIMQAVFNVLTNARQAVHGQDSMPRVTIRCRGDERSVEIAVADNGPGIPAAVRPRLFEPFVTGRRDGFGLGLSVVRQVIDAHGGRIEVTDAVPHGTVVSLYLPRRAFPAKPHTEKVL